MDCLADIFSQIGFVSLPEPVKEQDDKKPYMALCSDFEASEAMRNYQRNVEVNRSKIHRAPRKKITRCGECNIPMEKAEQSYICEGCGKVEELAGEGVSNGEGPTNSQSGYNTSRNAAAPVRITGPGSYTFQKKMISSTSNYKKQQRRNTLEQMENIIYQYDGPKPSPSIIREAADFYYEVQQHCIKRGDVRKGTMAACLYRRCIDNGITRKPKEISDMFGIPQKELSGGEKILDDLTSLGLIGGGKTSSRVTDLVDMEQAAALPRQTSQFYFDSEKQIDSFLVRYFEALSISMEYLSFARRLIRFTIKYKIADNSIYSSKCAGTIYILANSLGMDIKRDQIEKSCKISKSTFGRYSQAVVNVLNSTDPALKRVRSRLRQIFKRGNVPI